MTTNSDAGTHPSTSAGTATDVSQDPALGQGWTMPLAVRMVLLLLVSEVGFLVFAYPLNALPQIGAAFNTTQVAWMQTIYALTAAVTAGITGKVADRVGKRAVVLAVIAVVTLGSVLSAVAPTYGLLLVGRALQAPALALTFLLPSLVRDIFPARTVPLAVALSVSGSGALSIGSTFAVGSIITSLGYRATFWIPALFAIIVFALVVLFVPESSVRAARESLDWAGATLLGLGVGAILLGVSFGPTWGWTSGRTLASIAVGLLLLAGWIARSNRVAHPLIDLRQLADLRLTIALVFAAIGISVVTWFYVLIPLVTLTPGDGWGLGLTPSGESAIAALYTAGGFVAGFIVGKALSRFKTSVVASVSMVVIAAGFVLAAAGLSQTLVFALATFVVGGTTAAAYSVAYTLVMETVEPERQATTSAVVTLAGNLFSAILPVALFAVLNSMATVTAAGPMYPASAIRWVALIPAALAVVGLVCSLALYRSRVSTAPALAVSDSPAG